MKKILRAIQVGILLAPLTAQAQSNAKIRSLSQLVDIILGFLEGLVPLLFSFAVVFFLYNTVQFIKADPKGRESAKYGIIESIIGLFVMTAVYGLIRIIGQTFPLDNSQLLAPKL
jgi:hypothetical protein